MRVVTKPSERAEFVERTRWLGLEMEERTEIRYYGDILEIRQVVWFGKRGRLLPWLLGFLYCLPKILYEHFRSWRVRRELDLSGLKQCS